MLLDVSARERSRILDQLDGPVGWFVSELNDLAREHRCDLAEVDPFALQRVFIRRVPEFSALLSRVMREVPQAERDYLLDYVMDHPAFTVPALSQVRRQLEYLWADYLNYLNLWAEWQAVDISPDDWPYGLEGFHVQCFARPSDGKWALDFLGLASRPHPGNRYDDPMWAIYERDAQAVFDAFADWKWTDFIGMRRITPTHDSVCVEWSFPYWTPPEEIAALKEYPV